MPFGAPDSDTEQRFLRVFEQLIEPAVAKAGYAANRLDISGVPLVITDGIIDGICKNEFCVVDITDFNCNCIYELALRHGWNLPSVAIAEQDGKKLPFDVQDITVIRYRATPQGFAAARKKLAEQIALVEGSHGKSNNRFRSAMENLGKRFALYPIFEAKEAEMNVLIHALTKLREQLADKDFFPATGPGTPAAEVCKDIFTDLRSAVRVFTEIARKQHEVVDSREPCLTLLERMQLLQADGRALENFLKMPAFDLTTAFAQVDKIVDTAGKILRDCRQKGHPA